MGDTAGGDRQRSNVLKEGEQRLIRYLCPRMPAWVTPDRLTAFGVFGGVVVGGGLWLGTIHRAFLLLSIVGLAIHWFGDSLDGRLAYYRQIPRKWYGWSLDINADWTSACIIGLGFYLYLPTFKIVSFVFVVAYGGSIIVALLRYRVTDHYTIDSFNFGPTELRILLALALLIEIVFPGFLLLFGFVGSLVLIGMNLAESVRVLKLADERDRQEKAAAAAGER